MGEIFRAFIIGVLMLVLALMICLSLLVGAVMLLFILGLTLKEPILLAEDYGSLERHQKVEE